jgi:hypothetical protein
MSPLCASLNPTASSLRVVIPSEVSRVLPLARSASPQRVSFRAKCRAFLLFARCERGAKRSRGISLRCNRANTPVHVAHPFRREAFRLPPREVRRTRTRVCFFPRRGTIHSARRKYLATCLRFTRTSGRLRLCSSPKRASFRAKCRAFLPFARSALPQRVSFRA